MNNLGMPYDLYKPTIHFEYMTDSCDSSYKLQEKIKPEAKTYNTLTQ